MANNTYGAEVNVHEVEQRNGFISMRVYEPEGQDSGFASRWMDISIGDKSPSWMQAIAKTINKGDRLYVEGTLRDKQGKEAGKTFTSLNYLRRLLKLGPRVENANSNSTGRQSGGLDDF